VASENHLDEEAELRAARAGDRDAWARLVRVHAPRLGAYLGARLQRPAVVERLVGDAVVIGWERLDELEDGAPFAPWFRRIGGQLALRWHEEHPDEKLREPFPRERCDDDAQAARMRSLQEALRQLSEAQRMALDQRFRAGLNGPDLAEVLHCDPAAAEVLVEQALEALARALP
jgi:RNA polymerase sigma factor (sigma-70 family)